MKKKLDEHVASTNRLSENRYWLQLLDANGDSELKNVGNISTVSSTISGYTSVLVRWKKASTLIPLLRCLLRRTLGSSLMAVWNEPLVHRWACCLKPIISGGNSAGAQNCGR